MSGMRTVRDWVIATRPWSFCASVVPILCVASAMGCWSQAPVNWVNAALALGVILFLHAGANVLSDCRDHEQGVDGPLSLNGVTWIRAKVFQVGELRCYGLALVGVGALLGILLLARTDWRLIWIGVAGLVLSTGYSLFKFRALGDLAVLTAFALLPALGTGYVMTGSLCPETLLVALPPGLLTMAILHANNMRDVVSDAEAGILTLPGVVGVNVSKGIYGLETALPFAGIAVLVALGRFPWAALLVALLLPLVVRNLKRGLLAGGDLRVSLATLDRDSAQLQLLFGLLLASAFPLSRLAQDLWGASA